VIDTTACPNKFLSKARIATELYTFKDLQRELKARGLRASGKKQELKDRLEACLVREFASAVMQDDEDDGSQCVEALKAPLMYERGTSTVDSHPHSSVPAAVKSSAIVTLELAVSPELVQMQTIAPQVGAAIPIKLLTSEDFDNQAVSRLPTSTLSELVGSESTYARSTNTQSTNTAEQTCAQLDYLAMQTNDVQEQKQAARAKHLAEEREFKETEDAVRRIAAIQRGEEAEKRRQQKDYFQRADAAVISENKEDESVSGTFVATMHKSTPTSAATAPKHITPGQGDWGLVKTSAQNAMPKSLSPVDTYEISDREESTDDDEDNEERQRKHMPAWANGTNLREALRAQANSDPSAVFAVGASSCDLKHVFKTDRAFKKRTSSQNWGMDLSTQVERQKYRAEMGFTPPK
jgi:hypothetical protein